MLKMLFLNKWLILLVMITHPSHPATLEAEIRRMAVQGQLGQKVSMTPSQQTSWVGWFVPIISAI
jgi:hypothetical protein